MVNNLVVMVTELNSSHSKYEVNYTTLHNGAYESFRKYETDESIEEIKEYVNDTYGKTKIQIRKECKR